MTREEFEKTHPDYASSIEEWRFFMRSYFGGRFYRGGDYLLRHPFESAANYGRRKAIAYYYNYCAPIVDIMVSHLFKPAAKRDYGSFSKDPLFNSFLRDADLEGTGFMQFMREAQRLSSVYGRVSIVVDKPAVRAATRAEAAAMDIRPYVSLVTPENLLDWSFVRSSSGKSVLDMVKILEARDTCRVWTRQGWEVWRMEKDAVSLVDSGEHGLGVVPVVNLYNKRSGMGMFGLSDIQDIADINKNIYYLCSDAKEIIENTAFPMLALPYEKGAGEKEVGPKNILQFDPSEPNSRPYWLEAPHSSLTEIRQWVQQDIAEIFRIAKMGGVKATEDSTQPRSGVALELEQQQMHAALAEKADNVEHAEREVLKLWGMWEGLEFDGGIDYPDDFSVREIERDLEGAFRALDVGIESRTFARELQKTIAAAVLPKLDETVKGEIMREIDGSARMREGGGHGHGNG
ncbi:MAG: phage portal protein [Deltaproteobacteria bacterium]|nr:phage portal protein [Deltaproteobacteria bacterium]